MSEAIDLATHMPARRRMATPSGAASVSPGALRGATLAAGLGVILAAALAGGFPIGLSIVIVFLLAGPHNWFEARYMLGRLPARWGKLRGYFALGLGGVVVLTLAFAALPWLARVGGWSDAEWTLGLATWNTAMIAWGATLVAWRGRQNPRRPWDAAIPVGFVLIALNWLHPFAWNLLLVYAHPLLALWFLDRELGRQRSPWRVAYRRALWLVPVSLAAIVAWHVRSPDLPGDDVLTWQITRHAGADIVPHASTHMLVALHTFLELLHYGVWIVALPLASGAVPWRATEVPLARRSTGWRRAVVCLVALGALIMVGLWAAFLADYPVTRDLYFTIALAHVLAEVPFLLRLL